MVVGGVLPCGEGLPAKSYGGAPVVGSMARAIGSMARVIGAMARVVGVLARAVGAVARVVGVMTRVVGGIPKGPGNPPNSARKGSEARFIPLQISTGPGGAVRRER